MTCAIRCGPVGALLEAKSVHPGRTARNHLLFLAETQGLPARRVEEVLALVGLEDVADKRAGGFSLGMSQRLGVAVAMLVTRRSCCSTSRSTGSIPRASCGSGT